MVKYTGKYAGQKLPRRIIAMIIAVLFMGFGVALFTACEMGSDPYSTMNLGVASKVGLSFGTYQILVNLVLLILVIVLDRSMLGLGTLGNMFLVGLGCDFFTWLFKLTIPWLYEMSFVMRIIVTILGICAMLVGCSVYVTSNLGMSPYDAISFIVPNRTKINFRLWRIITDVICVVIGFFCGASVGFATIFMAFGTGPILPFLNKHFSAKLLRIKDIHKY